jgi:hypothetical protein
MISGTRIIFILLLTLILITITSLQIGHLPSPLIWTISLILGIPTLSEFYFNCAQGIINPSSKLNPDYKITHIKELLNPKSKPKCDALTYLNGRYRKNKNLTHLDYLALNLNLNSNERLTYCFSLFPIKGKGGRIWLRPYYKFSTTPILHFGITEPPIYSTKFITTRLSDLESFIPEYREETKQEREYWLGYFRYLAF